MTVVHIVFKVDLFVEVCKVWTNIDYIRIIAVSVTYSITWLCYSNYIVNMILLNSLH